MACDLKPSIERMTEKLRSISDTSLDALHICSVLTKDGQKYMALSNALGQISVHVRDTLTVRDYWYCKFLDDGVLKPCDVKDAVDTNIEPGRL